MFYSYSHLRRNGKFGIIWLAATKSKILNKREVFAVNIRMTCTDILTHIPGHLRTKEHSQQNKSQRFSLYLSAQLMFGAVIIHQKQAEYLLSDLNTLIRRIHPEVKQAADIDLVIRAEPCTLESCVPDNINDKYYDFFFGRDKNRSSDIESVLGTWDELYVRNLPSSPQQSPLSGKKRKDDEAHIWSPKIRSPHSVSDPREIQIHDPEELRIDPMVPGEQELPMLDLENLSLLQSVTESDGHISADIQGLDVSHVEHHVENLFTENQLGTSRLPALEETPAVISEADIPSTPQKPKQKRRHGSPSSQRKKRDSDTRAQAGGEDRAGTETQDRSELFIDVVSPQHAEPPTDSEPAQKRPRWEDTLPLQLESVTPTLSPMRKRRPHKLIIDQPIQITREEIKQNMTTHHTTSTTLADVLPTIQEHDLFKEPGSSALKSKSLCPLWNKNCRFGLKVIDFHSDTDSFTSPLPIDLKGKRQSAHARLETPEKSLQRESELQLSIEKQRDVSAMSASLRLSTHSHSTLAQVSDVSHASGRGTLNETPERQGSSELPSFVEDLQNKSLVPLLELEELVSPVHAPAIPEQELTVVNEGDMLIEEQHGSPLAPLPVLSLVRQHMRTQDDWTTFRVICPPHSTGRAEASDCFYDLLREVAKEALCVRQDEPYGEIFIWLPDASQRE